MGANMARRLLEGGHDVVVFDIDRDTVKSVEDHGARGASKLEELIHALDGPRAVWVMVPAGRITDETIEELASLLEPGDVIVDGGTLATAIARIALRPSGSRRSASSMQARRVASGDSKKATA